MRMVVQAMTLWFPGRASIGLGPGACSALRTSVRRGRRLPTECTGGARRQAPEKKLEGLVFALGESPPPVLHAFEFCSSLKATGGPVRRVRCRL